MITLGIDIGLTGAIAAVDSRGTSSIVDLPTRSDGKEGVRKRLAGRLLLDIVRSMVPPGEKGLVVIEDVQARPQGNAGRHGNTIFSQGSMMRSRGAIESVVDIAGLELAVVSPQTWKKFYGLIGTSKADSMAMAKKLYPDAQLTLVKHHNRAEALLLAHYAQRKLT